MTMTDTPTEQTTAEALAAAWNAEADEHDRKADQTADRFQAAAHRGVAEDLRARAAQTLSETEAGRRYAAEMEQRAALLADAQAEHEDAVARYRQLADEIPDLVDAGAAEVLAIAQRVHAHAVELADAQARAAATWQAVTGYGGQAPAVADYHDQALRELTAGGVGRSRVWNGARNSAAAATIALGNRAGELAYEAGLRVRGQGQ